MIHSKRFNLDAFLAIFAVIISAIMLSGVISYSSMVRKSRPLSDEISPQQQLITLGNLVGELQNAENSIRGYRLSRNADWLQSFYDHSIACSQALIDLRNLSDGDSDKHLTTNLLTDLVEQKLEILEAYSQLADRNTIVSELEGISRHFNMQTDTIGEPERRQGFIRSLFSRERVDNSEQDSLHLRVLAEVEQIRRKQRLRLMNIDALELEYMVKLIDIQESIENKVSAMRLEALRDVEETAMDRERRQMHANHMIRLFSITAVIFLVLGGLSIFRYIRKRRQFEKALKQAKMNAEMYSSMQQRFVANMSHEVRTPLHAIAGFTEQLANMSNSKEQQQYISLAQSAVNHLKQVVDDILDYSKLRAGKLKLKLEPFYPDKELDSVTAIFQMELKLKGLYLAIDNQLQSDNAVMGDALRFRQLLINTIGNAIKFTQKGGIQVKLYSERLQDQRQMLFIEVHDTGIGMNKEQLENVFTPFVQANNTIKGEASGTGLGLAITREIIEQQGGNISVSSEPGVGTKITAYIPYLEAGSYSEITPEEVDSVGFSLKGMNILIADDEEWNRKLTDAMLSKYEARITQAIDGNQAIELFNNKPFDLVLLDLRMPGKSGYEVAKLIRSSHNPTPPIIALTAQAGKDHETDYHSAGITNKLIKPFSEKELLEIIKKVMKGDSISTHHKTENAEPDYQSTPLKATLRPDEIDYVDKEKISKLGGGDQTFIKEMIEIFVSNSLDALSHIERAIISNDRETITWHTHKLAPPARQIGAYKMLSLLKELDDAIKKEQNDNILMTIFNELKNVTTQLVTALKKSYLADI